MTTISINIPDDRAARLKEIAARFNITLEELARVGVEDLLSRPDDAFQRAVERVLTKNAELYRRLA
jgi:predicted transcriptional regulator